MKHAANIAMTALLLCSPFSYAEDAHRHEMHVEVSAVETLSPALRTLLSREMRALQNAMQSIMPAYISGQWQEVADIAKQMKNSYILQQNLTDTQMHELHSSLPDAFLKLDQQFHYLSGMLSHAAEMEKPELVGFYFSKLSESCVSCHAQFASHKFPAFAVQRSSENLSEDPSEKHHH